MDSIRIGNKEISFNSPVYFIAEIGINHNGDLKNVEKLINIAAESGADAVKFQKRSPDLCVPENQKNIQRETPWGLITYLEYKKRIELEGKEFKFIDEYCKKKKIDWFCSCWDLDSLEFIKNFNPVAYKIPSALITDKNLLSGHKSLKVPIIVSTGMSTMKEIDDALTILSENQILLAHCTSSYPCPPEELNLNMIKTLKNKYPFQVGYSGHEIGIQTTLASVILGACFVERHITLDRSMWGTDQAASLEPAGLTKLIRDIKIVKKSLGDGIKKVYDSEKKIMKKLRVYSG